MNRKYFFIILFSLFAVFLSELYAQPQVSGVINAYSKVDSVFPTQDTIMVANPALFNEGDTVMVYQAKGAKAYVEQDVLTSIGKVQPYSNIFSSGKYEIIIISRIISAQNQVILRAALVNSYDPEGLVQLIRVPSYNNVRVAGTLTCDPWDGEKGGVLVLFANDTVYLEADIDVAGKGFEGADPVLSQGICSAADSLYFEQYLFSESSDSVGRKGEGIVNYDPLYAKGISPWGNGGGGGNARFAGGGGGSNASPGGAGGNEDTITCGPSPEYILYESGENTVWFDLRGKGGQRLLIPSGIIINDSTIFLGGGGGSGTYTSDLYAAKGGNGGGVVIILGKVIIGNNHEINANGENVTDISTASGAGGGAGGTIVFDMDQVQGQLKLLVTGGDGGNTEGANLSGPGGGGGGGMILYGKSSPSVDLSGGAGGTVVDNVYIGRYGAIDGDIAQRQPITKLPLTGFLFNSISQSHAICSGDTPNLISGSNPRGGNGIYDYSWEQSPDGDNWSEITDSTRRDLQPGPLFDTTYFRRIVESAGITDVSAPIRIVVHEWIVGNYIYPDDTISCIGNIADTINGTTVEIGGDGIYNYLWQSSFDMGNWSPVDQLNDTVCLPGEVLDTTFIRRVVQSGACLDTSRIVHIIGLPQIENNNLSESQEICFGQMPEEIIGENPTGGLMIQDSIKITWQKKLEGQNWETIEDSSRLNFAPPNLVETTYYRRIVESDECMDISDSLKINVLPLIDNNLITNNSTIYTCYETEPELLTGEVPEGGDNTYRYQWIKSIDGSVWTEITDNGTNKDYQPPELTEQTFFRRIVRSGKDNCCVDTSNTIAVNIHPLPVATINDFEDTICSGEEVILNFNITSGQSPYSFTFTDGYDLTTLNNIDVSAYNHEVYPTVSEESKVFNYTLDGVTDANGCAATDLTGLTKIVAFGWPESDAGPDGEECVLTYQMNAGITLGEGKWSQLDGPGNTTYDDSTLATTNLFVDSAGIYQYQWKEINWECVDSATVNITLYESPYNIDAGPDTSLFFTREYELSGSYINPDNVRELTSTWSFEKGSGSILSPGDTVTVIERLTDNDESGITVLWTIEKGVCEIITDRLNINIRPIFTPTGFTPNGDQVNDYLTFKGLEFADENKLVIFNRWGTEVFSEENFSNNPGWDGKNKKGYDLPEDTYYYILTVVNIDPETNNKITKTHKGFIVIKRR
ncbi:MAG TPA: gliding motility-associated C-terminal domain-containing protein [Bacteroidales bacterium]|nr:gliding motility-associated C-terminal domain-containing protein [Bacteroidales bacterium]